MSTHLPVTLFTHSCAAARHAAIEQRAAADGAFTISLILLASEPQPPFPPQARILRPNYAATGHPQACLCCVGQNGVAGVLRDAFLRALRRQEPRFSQVLIDVPSAADLATVRNVLRLDAFVSQRYRLESCLPEQDAPAATPGQGLFSGASS